MVRFLADECVWKSLVECLREAGYEVRSIAETASSISDNEVLAISVEEGLVLITEDNDFGKIVFGASRPAFGIVVVQFARFVGARGEIVRSIATRLMEMEDKLVGMLTMIEPGRTRQRRLPS